MSKLELIGMNECTYLRYYGSVSLVMLRKSVREGVRWLASFCKPNCRAEMNLSFSEQGLIKDGIAMISVSVPFPCHL